MSWRHINGEDEDFHYELPSEVVTDDDDFTWNYLKPKYVSPYKRKLPKFRVAILESMDKIVKRWPEVDTRKPPPPAPVAKKRTILDVFEDNEDNQPPKKKLRRAPRALKNDSDKENLPTQPIPRITKSKPKATSPRKKGLEIAADGAQPTIQIDIEIVVPRLAADAASAISSDLEDSAADVRTSEVETSSQVSATGNCRLQEAPDGYSPELITSSDYSETDSLFDAMLKADSIMIPVTTQQTDTASVDEAELKATDSPRPVTLTPFLRSFPDRITPTSNEISYLKHAPRILTCFRIAEVLRLHTTQDATPLEIELFARVKSSHRDSRKQYFQFADLFFPRSPPYVSGILTTWKDSKREEESSRALLPTTNTKFSSLESQTNEYKICRAIVSVGVSSGEQTKSKIGMPVCVEIMSIRQSGWEEADYVKGIVEPENAAQV